MNVFDASALFAFLQGEPGASTVERELDAGGHCGAANWSEVAQKVLAHGRDWAAHRWRRGEGLSVADRLCLALGERLDAAVWTSDISRESSERIKQIR